MKRADDYAQIINAATDDDEYTNAVGRVAAGLLGEFKELVRARRAGEARAMRAVLDELETKWFAICKRTEGLKQDGFAELIKAHSPDAHADWKRGK